MLKRFIREQIRRMRLRRAGLPEPIDFPIVRPGIKKDWAICAPLVPQRPVVYSFGVGANVAWDLGMIEEFGADVYAFDPTPESIAWVAKQKLPPRFHFLDCGIATFDGTLNFYPPKKPGGFHYSQDRQKFNRADATTFPGKVQRFRTICQQLGHTRLDVLKLDVEGTEFDCIPDILASSIEIGQLLVEVHYHYPRRSWAGGLQLLRQIEAAGFQCFDISGRGLEFSFANRNWIADCRKKTAQDVPQRL